MNFVVERIDPNQEFPPYNQQTPLYDFIEEDIDEAAHHIASIDENGRKVRGSIRQDGLEKSIQTQFRKRIKNHEFWTNVLGVNATTPATRLKAQRDGRVLYSKQFKANQLIKADISDFFGIGIREPGKNAMLQVTNYYRFLNDDDKIVNFINSGFIGAYARNEVKDWINEPKSKFRKDFPYAYYFTIKKDSFSEDVPFDIPMIHAVIFISKDEQVAYLSGLWRSLYGELRHFVSGQNVPRGLGIQILHQAFTYLKTIYPDLVLMTMYALEGTLHILNKAGVFVYYNSPVLEYNRKLNVHQDYLDAMEIRRRYPYIIDDTGHFQHYVYIKQLYTKLGIESRIACKLCLEPATHICTECKQELCAECSIKSEYC